MAEMKTTRSGPMDLDDYVGQQRAVDSRLSILEHGAKLFSEKGFDGCSTREVATAAGVSHANIRYHFGDKEVLWLKVIQYLIAESYQGLQLIAEIQSGKTPADNFRQHTRNVISYYAYHPELPRIIFFETLNKSDRLGKIKSAMAEVRKQRFETIEAMQEAGLIKNISSRLLSEFIESVLGYKFVVLDDIDRDDTQALEKLIDEYTELIVQLLEIEKPSTRRARTQKSKDAKRGCQQHSNAEANVDQQGLIVRHSQRMHRR